MHGIVLRPADHTADAQQRGDHLEVRWRTPPTAQPGRAGSGQGGPRRHAGSTHQVIEALLVVAGVAVLAVVLYVHTNADGGIGL